MDQPRLFSHGAPWLRRLGFEREIPWLRIVLVAALTWLPVIVLAAVQGVALGPTAPQSALLDAALHSRFLIATPLLLYAPFAIDRRLDGILAYFVEGGLVGEEGERYARAVHQATMAARSPLSDLLCLALAIGYATSGYVLYDEQLAPLYGASWHAIAPGTPSLAGLWYLTVGLAVFGFIATRFLYRLVLLWILFFRISLLKLRLNPLHADGASGLGILRVLLRPFRLPAFAFAANMAGTLINMILWSHKGFVDYSFAVGVVVAVISVALLGPLFLFEVKVRTARESRMLAHGRLHALQAAQFDDKWLAGVPAPETELMKSTDFATTNNLRLLMALSHQTGGLLRLRYDVVPFVLVTLVPFAFAAAAELPLLEVLKQLRSLSSAI